MSSSGSKKLRTILIYILIYFIAAFVGWIFETTYVSIMHGHLASRGFLYGPVLPVYGYGALLIALCLDRYKKHPIIVFLLSMVLTGVLEYLTGFIMFQIWHHRWWNYTNNFLNIQGFVCLKSILAFGVGGLLLIYCVKPLILKVTNKISTKNLLIITVIIFTIFMVDNIFSFLIKNNF